MSTNTSESFRIAPLRRLAAQPVTDPIELAALDALQKRGNPESVFRIMELCRELQKESASWFMGELVRLVFPEQRLAWIESLLVQLPPDKLEQVADQLLERLGKPTS
jgi:hypothetical protein